MEKKQQMDQLVHQLIDESTKTLFNMSESVRSHDGSLLKEVWFKLAAVAPAEDSDGSYPEPAAAELVNKLRDGMSDSLAEFEEKMAIALKEFIAEVASYRVKEKVQEDEPLPPQPDAGVTLH